MPLDLDELKRKGVQIHATHNYYSSVANNLAVGLQRMGIPVYGTIEYNNPQHSSFAFQAHSPTHDAGLNVYDLVQQANNWIKDNSDDKTDPSCILTMMDNVDSIYYMGNLVVFRAQSNRYLQNMYRHEPIGFGVTALLEQQATAMGNSQSRRPVLLRNFRVSGNQSVRHALDLSLLPLLEKHFVIDRMVEPRGTPVAQYYQRLSGSSACLTYGGVFHTKDELLEENIKRGVPADRIRPILDIYFKREAIIFRWDSWRFWESLAMGCLAIHLDFEKYGFELPVMPRNWVHYAGIDLDNLEQSVAKLQENWNLLPDIADEGRKWALEHYAPLPTAKRFLEKMGVQGVEHG